MSDQRIDFADVQVLTFDCYGTLIDWERGILDALHEVVGEQPIDDEALLEAYGTAEAPLEAGEWRLYREVLQIAMASVCRRFGQDPTSEQTARFGDSVARWPPFPDSAEALARLADRFELGVLTNCDDDLFASSNALLGDHFSWAVTAEQVRAYKPDLAHFRAALGRMGNRRDSWVHVAQSLYHDHLPAQSMGIRTVWINRRHGRTGSGATPAAQAAPHMTCPDMASFADIATGQNQLPKSELAIQERQHLD